MPRHLLTVLMALLVTLVPSVLLASSASAAPPGAGGAAALSLSPSSGLAGSATSVAGTGFGKRTSVTVAVGSVDAASLQTDSRGRFSVTVALPSDATGAVLISARSQKASASAPFSVLEPTPVTDPSTDAVSFGVTTPGGPRATAELDHVAHLAGEAPSVVMWYADFRQEPSVTDLDAVAARGATPLLTWEPWAWGGGIDQPAYALARISAGDFDPYLQRWAQALDSWGKPVTLRFAHEMNGTWYPWAEGVNGNEAGDYVRAYRHVHDLFTRAGVENVTWMWSPNVSWSGSTPLAGLYPGSEYVDVVGLDGYNWGTSLAGQSWASPGQIFDATLAEVERIAPGSQVVLAETSSSELGGSKAAWVSELFSWLPTRPQVTGFVWFHHQKETDWRIDSSESAASAFATGLATLRG